MRLGVEYLVYDGCYGYILDHGYFDYHDCLNIPSHLQMSKSRILSDATESTHSLTYFDLTPWLREVYVIC